MKLAFVVSTGRCGSTMLSRILHQHPGVLSVNEFFTSLRITDLFGGTRGYSYFPDGEMDGRELWQHGVFREVVPPSRLSFTFVWEEQGERGLETLVTISFADEGGRTRLTLRQTPFHSIAERDGHGGGWSSSFDRLDENLAGAN